MPRTSELLRTTVLLLLAWLPAAAGEPPVPEGMILVPAGDFIMGADDGNYDEAPAHRVRLSAYYIDRCEVTVAEFAAFVRAAGMVDTVEGPWFRYSVEGCVDLLAHYERRYGTTAAAFSPPQADGADALRLDADVLRWRAGVAALRVLLGSDEGLAGQGSAVLAATPRVQELIHLQAQLPVRGVSWRDAAAFAGRYGKRLPTEAEWEKAARGIDGRIYPWGVAWDATRCRAALDETAGPAPVGSHPSGASSFGCLDMAGNVWEWCADWYGPASFQGAEGAVDPTGPPGLSNGELPAQDPGAKLFRENRQGRETDTRKVIRGGCWARGAISQAEFNTRTTRRLWANPGYWADDTGFRCAKDAPAAVGGKL